MRILLDECVPKQLKKVLSGHHVLTVSDLGWAGLKNGDLLQRAAGDFDVILTVDTSFRYQQNLSRLNLCLVVVSAKTNDINDLLPLIPALLKALSEPVPPGGVILIP